MQVSGLYKNWLSFFVVIYIININCCYSIVTVFISVLVNYIDYKDSNLYSGIPFIYFIHSFWLLHI